MDESRKTVVNETKIKQLLALLLFTSLPLLCLLHQVHKWCDNLVEPLLVLDVVILAILCEYEFNRVLVKLLLPPRPFSVGPHNSLILHVAHSQLNLLVVLYVVRVAAGILAPEIGLRVKLIQL